MRPKPDQELQENCRPGIHEHRRKNPHQHISNSIPTMYKNMYTSSLSNIYPRYAQVVQRLKTN